MAVMLEMKYQEHALSTYVHLTNFVLGQRCTAGGFLCPTIKVTQMTFFAIMYSVTNFHNELTSDCVSMIAHRQEKKTAAMLSFNADAFKAVQGLTEKILTSIGQ